MTALRIVVAGTWVVFGIYWGVSALWSKRGTSSARGVPMRLLIAVVVVLLFRFVHPGSLDVHSVVAAALGTAIVFGGLGFAVWARISIGRNWGMPMSQKEEKPELVTSGRYGFVRHPIYTGVLVAAVGTALAINLLGSGRRRDPWAPTSSTRRQSRSGTSPPYSRRAYPAYRARTKMLIPFLF